MGRFGQEFALVTIRDDMAKGISKYTLKELVEAYVTGHLQDGSIMPNLATRKDGLERSLPLYRKEPDRDEDLIRRAENILKRQDRAPKLDEEAPAPETGPRLGLNLF